MAMTGVGVGTGCYILARKQKKKELCVAKLKIFITILS
jgi:hypothetical protein